MHLDMDFICLPMSGGKRHSGATALRWARDGGREKATGA